MPPVILIVDDDLSMCRFLQDALKMKGYDPSFVCSGAEALDSLRSRDFDCFIIDLNLPRMNGIELCERLVGARPDIPVIILTSFGSFESAVAGIRSGAYDFLTKPIEIESLALSVQRAVQHRRLSEEVKRLKLESSAKQPSSRIGGESPGVSRLREMIERVAGSDAPILIAGESGTGKEVAALEIHRQSALKQGPFLPINMTALPDALFESELFGSRVGSESKPGMLQRAAQGSIFFDEIGDVPLHLQAKLLRVLQDGRFKPLGEETEIPLTARIICATSKDLESAVEEGSFRRDLYYRINVLQLNVPPLRARGNDILILSQQFIEEAATRQGKKVKGMSRAVAEKLLSYSWPGNIRELLNCMERAVVLAQFEEINLNDLPEKIANSGPPDFQLEGIDNSVLPTLAEIEMRYISHVFEVMKGNRKLTAEVLGIDRKTLYRKLKLPE